MRSFLDSRRAQVRLKMRRTCRYCDINAVPGHKSALAFGLLGAGDGVPVVAMLGRVGLVLKACEV